MMPEAPPLLLLLLLLLLVVPGSSESRAPPGPSWRLSAGTVVEGKVCVFVCVFMTAVPITKLFAGVFITAGPTIKVHLKLCTF